MFITRKKHLEALEAMRLRITKEVSEAMTMSNSNISLEFGRLQSDIDTNVKNAEERIRADAQAIFQEALAADRKKRYDSQEPFVEIVSESFSDEGGVQLRLDWNAAFIKYLRSNGFTGPSDEVIVDNWLISLSRERIAEGGSEFK